MESLLADLTPAQRDAVVHPEGPLLILAGPGSGKTRVITHRIAYLLERGVQPHQILALTFTNKAAEEMRGRIERLAPDQSVWISTFHRFCARLLRKYAPLVGLQENYTIYDAEDSRRVLRRVVENLGIDILHFTPEAIGSAISWAKNNLIRPEDYHARPGHALGSIVDRVYPAYQSQLGKSNAADFDDLLLHVATLLRENREIRRQLDERYRFVMVDEYQDTNLAQYVIARALSVDHPNLAVTGDPDQSIYGWRGANLKNILDFEDDFPQVRVVRLERNYRSTKRILNVAAALIACNVKRKEKDLYTNNGEGKPVRLVRYADHKEEARSIAARIADDLHAARRRPSDFAIFYRVNALSLEFERALREQGIPYQLVRGQEFFQRKEIKDILAYLQLLGNPHNDVALLRVINTPVRGIGKTTVGRLTDHATRNGLTLLDAARQARQIDSLSNRTVTLLVKFVALVDRLSELAGGPIEELLGHVLAESGYRSQLRASSSEADLQRLANIEQLLSVGRDFDEQHPDTGHLEEFLEETSLVSDTDDWESETDRVTLMTLHASKGLEFPVIYLVAVEQGLLPHERSRNDSDQFEEERRLMFVGITRAQQELQISLAHCRDFRGQRRVAVPSPFLMELPRGEMELHEVEALRSSSSYIEAVDAKPARRPAQRPAAQRAAATATLTTAAELAQGSRQPAVSPDDFRQNMLVRHPRYGLGRVIALSGGGDGRKATIDFHSPAARKRFLLKSSPLRPVVR